MDRAFLPEERRFLCTFLGILDTLLLILYLAFLFIVCGNSQNTRLIPFPNAGYTVQTGIPDFQGDVNQLPSAELCTDPSLMIVVCQMSGITFEETNKGTILPIVSTITHSSGRKDSCIYIPPIVRLGDDYIAPAKCGQYVISIYQSHSTFFLGGIYDQFCAIELRKLPDLYVCDFLNTQGPITLIYNQTGKLLGKHKNY